MKGLDHTGVAKPLTRLASLADLTPQAGRGEIKDQLNATFTEDSANSTLKQR